MLVSSLSFLPHCEILCSWDCILLHLSVPRKMSIIPNTWSEPFRKSPFISQLLRVNTVSIYKWIWWGPWLYKCLCWKSIALSKYVSLCSLQRPHQYFVDACEAILFPILQGRELRLREVRSGAQVTQLVMVGLDFECGAWFFSSWVFPLISLGILITFSRIGRPNLTSAKNLGNEPINCLKFSIFSYQSLKWLWSETCCSFVISLWYLSLKGFLSSTSLVKIQFFLISSFYVL